MHLWTETTLRARSEVAGALAARPEGAPSLKSQLRELRRIVNAVEGEELEDEDAIRRLNPLRGRIPCHA